MHDFRLTYDLVMQLTPANGASSIEQDRRIAAAQGFGVELQRRQVTVM